MSPWLLTGLCGLLCLPGPCTGGHERVEIRFARPGEDNPFDLYLNVEPSGRVIDLLGHDVRLPNLRALLLRNARPDSDGEPFCLALGVGGEGPVPASVLRGLLKDIKAIHAPGKVLVVIDGVPAPDEGPPR
jgi:hypothetical protein